MMFFCGLLALLQICFLPGWLFLQTMRSQRTTPQTLLFSFGLSLVINYFITSLLTLFHGYTRLGVYVIFIVEVAFAIKIIANALPKTLFSENKQVTSQLRKQNDISFELAQKSAFLFVIWMVCFYLYGDNQSKIIFSLWDAVVSWNRWALDWYQNKFPLNTAEYPQLLPINISLTYQFIGNTSIQLFGKLLFYCFPFAVVTSLWHLGEVKKQPAYFWSIGFFSLFLISMFGELSVSGYADIPVASLAMLAVYALLVCDNETNARVIKHNCLIGTLICAGSALTKQPGLELAAIYPIIMYILVFKNNTAFSKISKIKWAILTAILLITLITPWYVYKFLQFKQGLDHPMVNTLMQGGGHHELAHPTFSQRFLYGFHILLADFHLPFKIINSLLIVILIVAACFSNRIARNLTILLVLPMFFIWAGFFSYDIRNIAFVLPFASIVLGFGFQQLFNLSITSSLDNFLQKKTNLAVCLTAIAGILTLSFIYKDERLLAQQSAAVQQIGNYDVNKALYAYFEQHSSPNKIFTNYQIMHYLPKLDAYYEFCSGESISELLMHGNELKQSYILIIKNRSKNSASTLPLENYLAIHSQQFNKIFEINNYLFYKVS